MINPKNVKQVFDNFCTTRGSSPEEVEAILSLYGSDFDEDEIERRLEEYSEASIKIASNILTGLVS